ncbi:MAG: DoxX family protein [bacterium]
MNATKKTGFDVYSAAGLAARLVVGGVFIYSGFLKSVAPPEEFAAVIEGYKILPVSLTVTAASFMSWTELFLGVFLVCGFLTRQCALAAAGLLAFFELLLFSVVIRKIPLADCGCFGTGGSRSVPYAIAEDAVLLILALLAFRYGHRLFALDSWAAPCGEKK